MNSGQVRLIANNLHWFSDHDEAAFFEWLDKISCVENYNGQENVLNITINEIELDDNCLREIIALFYRFKQEMTQLAVFRDDAKRPWFSNNRQAFWYKKVFGPTETATK
jgi:hypothetical protein